MRLLAWHALRGKLGVPPGLMALRNGDPLFSGSSILGSPGPRPPRGPGQWLACQEASGQGVA